MSKVKDKIVNFKYDNKDINLVIHGDMENKKGELRIVDSVSNRIYKKNTFYDLEKLESTLQYMNKDSVVVDCGANIGNHTVFWSKYVKKVYAIEPLPMNFEILKRNVEANNCNAEIFNNLLSHKKESFICKSNKKSLAATRFIKNKKGDFYSVTLDSIINEKVDFIKIDVEGAELKVLKGAKRILSEDHPFLVIEIHYFDFDDMDEQVLKELEQYGYVEQKDLILFRRNKK